jgi:hypothetical protein
MALPIPQSKVAEVKRAMVQIAQAGYSLLPVPPAEISF